MMSLLYNFYFCIVLLNIQFYVICICEFIKGSYLFTYVSLLKVKSVLKLLTSFTSINNIFIQRLVKS